MSPDPTTPARLLAIVELGGYPNLTALYRSLGFAVEVVNSQRKAQAVLKRAPPEVIVAEYNFQSDFRDRTSNLETLMANLQRHPQVKIICLYPPEYETKLQSLVSRFPVFAAIPLPVNQEQLASALTQAIRQP